MSMPRSFSSKKMNPFTAVCLAGLLLAGSLACSSSTEKGEGEGVCCQLGDDSVPGVILEKVCRKRRSTDFHFQLTVALEACVDLKRTSLEDDGGRAYAGVSHAGLADCAEPLTSQPAGPFTWTFERIESDVQSLALKENYKLDVQPWMSWKWENIDVAHCTF